MVEPFSGQEKTDPTQPTNRRAERGEGAGKEKGGGHSEVGKAWLSESRPQRALPTLARSRDCSEQERSRLCGMGGRCWGRPRAPAAGATPHPTDPSAARAQGTQLQTRRGNVFSIWCLGGGSASKRAERAGGNRAEPNDDKPSLGHLGGLNRLSFRLLTLAQVTISGWRDPAPRGALHRGESPLEIPFSPSLCFPPT